MASLGNTRKTSNGCAVAIPVPRKDAGFRVPSSNIAAIDFGTTNCSLAYITVGYNPTEGPARLSLGRTRYRVPNAILFNPDGTVHAFGSEARVEYTENLDDEDRLAHAYFEHIKMTLQHDEKVSRETTIAASNGKKYFLIDVIAHILKYLKDQLIDQLKRETAQGLPTLLSGDFDWVITVPAIWRAKGKQMMREAGYKAGLCSGYPLGKLMTAEGKRGVLFVEESMPEKLSLALEPEVAAIFCQNMRRGQLAKYADAEKLKYPFVSNRYIVVDIGGGTVDISLHQVTSAPDYHIDVIKPPAGNDCGGSMVNKEFMKFLEKLVDDRGFHRLLDTDNEVEKAKNMAYLKEIELDIFEKQKNIFADKGGKGNKVSIRLPYNFMAVYQGKLQETLSTLNDSEIEFSGSNLKLTYTKMREFFKPVVDGLLQCISKSVEMVPADVNIDSLYIVGGFGGCKYVFNAIQEKFGSKYQCVTPVEPEFAVVRGAVLARHNVGIVKTRTTDATYGIRAHIPFNPEIHEKDYEIPGEHLCDYIFSTFVEAGEVVETSKVLSMSYPPTKPNQTEVHIDIYRSPEKDVWYTTGKRPNASGLVEVKKIGDLTIPLPPITEDSARGEDEKNPVQRIIDVRFDFGQTEIQVQAFDSATNTEVKSVVDFLSS